MIAELFERWREHATPSSGSRVADPDNSLGLEPPVREPGTAALSSETGRQVLKLLRQGCNHFAASVAPTRSGVSQSSEQPADDNVPIPLNDLEAFPPLGSTILKTTESHNRADPVIARGRNFADMARTSAVASVRTSSQRSTAPDTAGDDENSSECPASGVGTGQSVGTSEQVQSHNVEHSQQGFCEKDSAASEEIRSEDCRSEVSDKSTSGAEACAAGAAVKHPSSLWDWYSLAAEGLVQFPRNPALRLPWESTVSVPSAQFM